MNKFGDQIYNMDGSRRTMKRRKDNHNTQPRAYSARSYATNVKEDKTSKDNTQNKGNGRINPKDRGGGYKEPPIRKCNDKEARGNPKRSRLPCRVCSQTTYSNLLGCSKFKKYIPGQPDGSISLLVY